MSTHVATFKNLLEMRLNVLTCIDDKAIVTFVMNATANASNEYPAMCQRLQLSVMPAETDDLGADYLLAGDWMPEVEDIEAAFEVEEPPYSCLHCWDVGCFYCR